MSQKDVELVRASYEFANRTQTPDLDAFVADCEWHTRADLPDAGIRRGHDGLVKLASEWFGAFDHFRLDVEELLDAGASVVVVTRLRGQVRSSHGEVDLAETQVCKMRDGKIAVVRAYRTKAEALKAVELEE
jgi:ketosteroid isomerase-like protein